MKFFGQCPVCGAALHLARLSCPGCKAEFPTDEPLSPYERLAPEYAQFLQTFLACRGSMKDVQNELGISYPTAKKKLDELLLQLNLRSEEESEIFDMSLFTPKESSAKASDIVRSKLYENSGRGSVFCYRQALHYPSR